MSSISHKYMTDIRIFLVLPLFFFKICISSVNAAGTDEFSEENNSTINCNACNDDAFSVEAGMYTELPSHSPSQPSSPQIVPPDSVYNNNGDWGATTATSVDVLVAALFLIAAGWLVLAIIYSVLILIVVRMRARGELDIYDENFGRLFLLGTRCYIPLGCILRRHVVAMQSRNRRQSLHIMTRDERRTAMEILLTDAKSREIHEERKPEEVISTEGNELSNTGFVEDDAHPADEPMCSICLMEYEENDIIFKSPKCVHRFHQECLMDWLERRNNTDCPCCREQMVADEDVWDTVQQLRREQRKLRRLESRRNNPIGRLLRLSRTPDVSEENPVERMYQINDIEEGGEEYDGTAAIASVELSNSTSLDLNNENCADVNSIHSFEQSEGGIDSSSILEGERGEHNDEKEECISDEDSIRAEEEKILRDGTMNSVNSQN